MATAVTRGKANVPYDPTEHTRLVVHVTKALEARVRAYQRRQQMVTLSETLRRLLTVGLEAEERREHEAKKGREER